MQNSIEIYNEVEKSPIINWDFLYGKFFKIKNDILGKRFELSISILKPKNAQKINKKMRGKTYVPNTLSFKYSKTSGEIVLCPEVILKERQTILYMFIHSCLHLTNLDHGPKMDKLEKKFIKKFAS